MTGNPLIIEDYQTEWRCKNVNLEKKKKKSIKIFQNLLISNSGISTIPSCERWTVENIHYVLDVILQL